jgi:secondary thiamine-phosphate synthase enzyme
MHHTTLTLQTSARDQLVDLTSQVEQAVHQSGMQSGIATVFVPHTTAAVTINENFDPDVQSDMLGWLRQLVPQDAPFRHDEGNSDGHLKASLVGFTVQVPFVEGRMLLGQWQAIYFCEFDGPRRRQVEVVIA